MNIPILAETATEVFHAALDYPTAGYSLVFYVVGEGEWRVNQDKFEKLKWIGNIPLTERVEGHSFYNWMIGQIKHGFVGIFVQSSGKNPHYKKELHRARGIQIPLE